MQLSHAPEPADRLTQIERARHAVLDLAQPAPSGTPDWLARSWRRCLDRGFQPGDALVFDGVAAAERARVLDHNHRLLQAARPVIRSLAEAVAGTRYFTLLTDARGVVIDVSGEIDTSDSRATNLARVGVDLSEQAVGTTAIGATLGELQPVWLHRGEHFFRDTSVYSCAGAPLLGPDGQCVGMLDLTGIQVPELPALRHLVVQSARRIENTLVVALARAHPDHLLLRLAWPGQPPGGDADGLLAVGPDGCLLGHNPLADDMLGLRRQGAQWLDQVFATDAGHLFDLARHGHPTREVPLWSGLRVGVLAQTGAQLTHFGPSGSPGLTPAHAPNATATEAPGPLRDVEDAIIRQSVQTHRGNVAAAAKALGISRATVYRKLGRKG